MLEILLGLPVPNRSFSALKVRDRVMLTTDEIAIATAIEHHFERHPPALTLEIYLRSKDKPLQLCKRFLSFSQKTKIMLTLETTLDEAIAFGQQADKAVEITSMASDDTVYRNAINIEPCEGVQVTPELLKFVNAQFYWKGHEQYYMQLRRELQLHGRVLNFYCRNNRLDGQIAERVLDYYLIANGQYRVSILHDAKIVSPTAS